MVDLTNGLNTAQIGQGIQQGMNTTAVVVLFSVVILLFFGVIGFMLWYNSFKIRVRVWIITGTKSLCIDDRAKLIKKKGQAPKWKLRGRKDFIPIPPDDCISINKKGFMVVEAFYTENGQYIYKKNINDPNLDVNDPLTTIDKEFYLNEHVDAVNKYKKKTWVDVILQLAPSIIILMIFIVFFAFWGKTIEPFQEMGDQIIAERQADRQHEQEMHDVHRAIIGTNNTNIYDNNPFKPAPN